MGLFDGKVVLLTGSGGPGIGSTSARRFAQEGAQLAVSDRDEELARYVADTLRNDLGSTVMGLGLDVSDESSVRAAVAEVVRRFGRIDVLVNNAGFSEYGSLLEATLESWNRVLATCLTGAFLMIRECVPHMGDGGAIVSTASVAAWTSNDDSFASYVAAKAGLLGLTRAAAAELGKRGIRVNAVAPGFVDHAGTRARIGEEVFADTISKTPLGRICRPEDVAEAVLYLASAASSFVTGEALCVSGGAYDHA